MPNLLCICIPTFNRIDKLRKSLSYHAQLCMKHGIGLVVSDNASSDATSDLLVWYKEQYSWFDYYSHRSNQGPDANFEYALKLGFQSGANYMWLLGDDDFIESDSLHEILKRLDEEKPDMMIVNTRNQVSNNLPGIYTSRSNLLRDLAWHSTFISSLIFSRAAAAYGIEPNHSSPNFSHVFGVFNFLAGKDSIKISWAQRPSIYTLRYDCTLPSWFPHLLDIFVSNWVKTIKGLPSNYSATDKNVAIKSLWLNSKILNVKMIIFLIFKGELSFADFWGRAEEIKLVFGNLRFYLSLLAFLVPKFLSKRIAKLGLNHYVKKRVLESRSLDLM